MQQENSYIAEFFKQYESSNWYSDKLRDSFVLGGVLLLSSFSHFIANHYGRQITLSLVQKNISTRDNYTQYHYGETNQHNRTIELELQIKRQQTSNYILSLFLNKFEIYILLKCNSPSIELQAVDEPLKLEEIIPIEDGTGFYIDITNYLKSIIKHKYSAYPRKVIPYFIKETRTQTASRYVNSDETTHINPELLVTGFKRAPWLLKKVLGWNADQHEVRYFNGRM